VLFQLYHYIINVGFDVCLNLIFQDGVYALLIRAPPLLQLECILSVAENLKQRDE
jgi:hypothetical protein